MRGRDRGSGVRGQGVEKADPWQLAPDPRSLPTAKEENHVAYTSF